jgi:hypothetical protein
MARGQIELPAATVNADYSCQAVALPQPTTGTIFLATGLPTGLSMNASTGVIGGRPVQAGSFALVLRLVSQESDDSFEAHITVSAAAGAPSIMSAASATATVGQSFAYLMAASPEALSFDATPLPSGLSLNGSTGALSGSPTQAGSYSISLSASNAQGMGPVSLFQLMVNATSSLPTVTEDNIIACDQGTSYTHQIAVDKAATSYSAEGLPSGLVLNPLTGVISGTAQTPGVYTVTIRASNAAGTGTARTVSFVVGALPIITSTASLSVPLRTALSDFRFTATNSPISFNVYGLPEGMTVDTLTGQLQGAPSAEGVFTLRVSANNALGTGPESILALSVVRSTQNNNSPLSCFAARAWVNGSAGIENTFITGFLISGPGSRQLLLRGVGPGLQHYQVNNPLGDPKIRLFRGDGILLLENDNWGGSSQLASAFVKAGVPTLDASSKDAATVVTLEPGAYTLHVTAPAGTTGVALTEVYDISDSTSSTSEFFRGFASRCRVVNDEGVAIGGFVIGGSQTKRVLIRGLGPELAKSQVSDYLTDPVVKIYGSDGVLIAQNDQWEDQSAANGLTQENLSSAQLRALCTQCGLAELGAGSKDAAMVVVLPPGAYTVHVAGVGGKTGVGLVEIYVIPE